MTKRPAVITFLKNDFILDQGLPPGPFAYSSICLQIHLSANLFSTDLFSTDLFSTGPFVCNSICLQIYFLQIYFLQIQCQVNSPLFPICFRTVFPKTLNADRIIACINQKLRNGNFTCENLFIILVIFAEKLRDVQFIGTFFHALTAINTVLDLFHVFLPGL